MKITIVTVSYNSSKTIEQTIRSVVDQTYTDIEYIIIDGGSTDGTVEIIKKYEDKIAYWVSEIDNGIYDAMNKAIEIATGDYIQFLGSDDCLVCKEIVEVVANCLMEDKEIDILSGQVWVVDEELYIQQLYKNSFDSTDVYNGYVIHHQGMFVKRYVLANKKFNTDYKIVGDYDFFLNCYFSPNVRFKYIHIPISFYSNSGISNTSTKRILEHIDVMKKYNLNPDVIKNMLVSPSILSICMRRIKKGVKKILDLIGASRYVKKIVTPEWKDHTCEWDFCRWCNKI